MRIRGFMAMLMLAALVVVVLYIVKSGGTAKIEKDVETFTKSKALLTKSNFKILSRAVDNYTATQGRMPASLDALSMHLPITSGKLDGWGRAIRFEPISDESFRLTSAGPDGRFRTADDISQQY